MHHVLQNIEIIKYDLNKYKILKEESNVFTYAGAPSDELNLNFVHNYMFNYKNDFQETDESEHETYNKLITQSNLKSEKSLNKKIKTVIAYISYPLHSEPIVFKFNCEHINLTYGKLLYLYTYAYKKMFELDDIDVFHSLDDLVYNGESILKFTKDTVICEFYCDS